MTVELLLVSVIDTRSSNVCFKSWLLCVQDIFMNVGTLMFRGSVTTQVREAYVLSYINEGYTVTSTWGVGTTWKKIK